MTEVDYCYSCDICKGLGQAARSPRLSSWTFLSSARNCGSKSHCAQQLVTAFSISFLAHYHCSLHNTNAHVFWSLLMSSVLSIFMSIWSTPAHLLHTLLNPRQSFMTSFQYLPILWLPQVNLCYPIITKLYCTLYLTKLSTIAFVLCISCLKQIIL